ncbi:MAG: hypothetical protein R3B82_25100 [Sandaracinaceae bacterium]
MPLRARRTVVEALRPRDVPALRVRPIAVEPDDEPSGDEVGIHWIEIELLDMSDQPVAGERYQIELPDGSVRRGVLDGRGRARVDRLKQAGTCKVTFPNLDEDAWEGVAG